MPRLSYDERSAYLFIAPLAAVLGGCQSLHCNALDEALALPTEQAVTVALRTQHIIADAERQRTAFPHAQAVSTGFLEGGKIQFGFLLSGFDYDSPGSPKNIQRKNGSFHYGGHFFG